MAGIDDSLDAAMEIPGAVAVALVDLKSGLCLGELGSTGRLDLEIAAAGNAEMVRCKMRVIESLALDDTVEDILITLGNQYHLVRLVQATHSAFLYLVLRRSDTNLALPRYRLTTIEEQLALV